MNKKTLIIIAAVVVLALIGGGLYLAHVKRQEAIAAEEARKAAEEAARKEAEKKAAEEKAKKEAEEKAKTAEEVDKALDIGLTEEIDAALPEEIKQANEEFLKEARAITEVLIKLNKAQNTKDYRTMTGEEGFEYMTERYREEEAKKIENKIKLYKENQVIVNFKGIKIQEMTIGKDRAEVTYDGTTEANSIKGIETGTLRTKAILVKENGIWQVDSEETLGRVVDNEN